MKHSHYHENLRSAGLQLKQGRWESTHPTTRAVRDAGTSDDWQPEANSLRPTGNGQGTGALSDQRLELRQAADRNKDSWNPMQSSWPTPAK